QPVRFPSLWLAGALTRSARSMPAAGQKEESRWRGSPAARLLLLQGVAGLLNPFSFWPKNILALFFGFFQLCFSEVRRFLVIPAASSSRMPPSRPGKSHATD